MRVKKDPKEHRVTVRLNPFSSKVYRETAEKEGFSNLAEWVRIAMFEKHERAQKKFAENP